jgi:hypothetical protein
MKLKELLNEEFGSEEIELTTEDKKNFMENVRNFNKFGQKIRREVNLRSLAEELSKVAKLAEQIALSEAEEQFDKVTINRNMKELKKISSEFHKAANEAQSVQERVSSLYEDMGNILNRYFEIDGEDEYKESSLQETADTDNFKVELDRLISDINRGVKIDITSRLQQIKKALGR